MPITITIDRGACVGYASCMMIAPKVFSVDDEDLVVVLDEHPSDAMLAKVEQAARSCPKSAIAVRSTE